MSLAQTHIPQPPSKTQNFRLKYKTEKCRYLQEKGYCPYAQHCTFAHFDQEVRFKTDVPPNYRTKPCINFTSKGYCTYGERCQYLHLTPEGQKTRSSSEESASSRSSHRSSHQLWQHLTHNKRVELIQHLGLDFAVRKSSRLIQLLNSNQKQSEYSTDEENELETEPTPSKEKKYSM